MRKRQLPLTDEEFAERKNVFLNELDQETDRGLVLVSAAILEENLEILIRSVMRKGKKIEKDVLSQLFRADGPLGSFSGKIRICYAFELIDQTLHKELNIIREVRNEFAHSYNKASLNSGYAKDKVLNIETGKLFEHRFTEDSSIFYGTDSHGKKVKHSQARRILTVATVVIAAMLEGYARNFQTRQALRYSNDA